MPRFLRYSVTILLLVTMQAMAAKPQRIVSIGLCTDQLLLMLAEPGQIASVSTWAKDRNMSYMNAAIGDIPLNNASVEEVIRFSPDLVLASDYVAWNTVRFLRELGYRVEQVPVPTSIDGIYDLLTRFGEVTGNEQRAAAAIEQMRRRIDETRARYAARPVKSVIIYSPNGMTVGAETLEHDLFIEAGYRNLAAEMGISGFQSISLEQLIAADPDVLQIDRRLSPQASLATAYLGHPVVQKLLRQREYLDIPTRLRICAGPMITEAIEMMAARR
ncbi:MAG: ABC transporter substrate-binding protein [Gammaproteobacteria bacterium]|nr:ABC transporter substrate-binding protein [Gammaproteobacteria bacterium]